MRCAFGFALAFGLSVAAAGCSRGNVSDSENGTAAVTQPGYEVAATDDASAPGKRTYESGELVPAARRPETEVGVRKPHRRETRTDEFAVRGDREEPVTLEQARTWTPAPQPKPGTLTAGSIDDNARFDEFRAYRSETLQKNSGRQFPTVAIGRRAVIRVKNRQGEGIGDVQVTVRPAITQDDSQAANASGIGRRTSGAAAARLFHTTTGSDGRALFLSGLDVAGGGSEFLVSVKPPGDAQSVTRRFSLDQPVWNFDLQDAERNLPVALDLALVIDTTGSMSDELEYLKVEIDHIAAAVHDRFPNVHQRYALVLYRDEDDEYVTRTFDFTESLRGFRNNLSAQSAGGGGDYPEAMHLALEQAAGLSWCRDRCAQVLFLVGDAPPHVRFADRTLLAIDSLRAKNVTLFPVAASGVRDEAEWIMRSAAFLTLGRYLFLTDHSGVGNPHAKPHANQFAVERLDALLIRMIASELAGRELLPSENIATDLDVSANQPRPHQVAGPAPRTLAVSGVRPIASTSGSQDILDIAGRFLGACGKSPVFRIFVAAVAIVLIWSLDSRRRESEQEHD